MIITMEGITCTTLIYNPIDILCIEEEEIGVSEYSRGEALGKRCWIVLS